MADLTTDRTFGMEEIAPFIGQRLDVFLAAITERSRSRVQGLLKAGLVRLEPHAERMEASYRLREGDSITLAPGPAEAVDAQPKGEDIPLDILYEDESLMALNKQPGLVVHPAVGHRTGTLINALVHHRGVREDKEVPDRMGLVHRLDKDTSGIMLVAKTEAAHEKLALAFADREVRKVYRALCWGVFRRASGECRQNIGRHKVHRQKMTVLKTGGRIAHTDYRVLAQGALGAEVECRLYTGRTHQIRVHLSHLLHPVWGDLIYGKPHVLASGYTPPRQMLHAAWLEITHPMTGQPLRLEAAPPRDYLQARGKLIDPKPKK